MRQSRFLVAVVILFGMLLSPPLSANDQAVDGDTEHLVSLAIDPGRSVDGTFHLAGRASSQQLLVTGAVDSQREQDITRSVRYEAFPEGIVSVDETGWIRPLSEGKATVRVVASGDLSAETTVLVTDISVDLPVNFPNEVTPVFTKYGCNGGGCHGKSGGQNGFKLSLLGFEPPEDYEYIVKEARGRRVFPAAPDRSLLLLKGAGVLPHGGGARLEVHSPPYVLLRRWVEQGMPYGEATAPVVKRIEVLPHERILNSEGQQQLAVIAHFSDGSTQDVTRMTQFTSNDTEMAEVSETGLVETGKLSGTIAVMTRYQGSVDVFRGILPLGVPIEHLPPARNLVDELVFKQLTKLGMPPSATCDDATFIRRVTVDITGRLPNGDETNAFLSATDEHKRDVLIERLLASAEYADFFANKWSSILRNKRQGNEGKLPTYAFHNWIRQSLYDNVPFDDFVRDVLTASGDVDSNPPVAWYNEVKDASAQLEDTAQLFLGLRIQCARCHHHPFEKWSQQDYYQFSAFFSQVGRKKPKTSANNMPDIIYHKTGVAQAKHLRTNASVKPAGLGGPILEIAAEDDPRHQLVDWMTAVDNPFFARALVNRYWKHFFSRGLVDPEDDMRVTNPASNPELLDALGEHFVEQDFDLKDLVRTICSSQVYQLSAEPNDYNQTDKQNFSRYYPKRLNAEVLLDAIDQLTLVPTKFAGMPMGTRAVQLPDNAFNSYFLTVFGRPEAASACECERSSEANLAQSLHLLNSSEIQGKVSGTRATNLASDAKRDHTEKLRELYLVAFSREPVEEELAIGLAHIKKNEKEVKRAYEDIIWALVNTKEFLFNH